MLQRQSNQTLMKADLLLVKEVMRIHGDTPIRACKKMLVQMGFIDPVTNEIVAPAPSLLKPQVTSQAQKSSDAQPWDEGMGSTWSASSVKFLRTRMALVDPVAMSEANVRKLGKKHAKEPPKPPLLEHFEFYFGLDVNGTTGEYENEYELTKFLTERYEQHGERAALTPMPIDFGASGAWSVKQVEGLWRLFRNLTDSSVIITGVDDPHGKRRLYVEQNFSDSKATIRDHADKSYIVNCQSMFASAMGGWSSNGCSAGVKRRRITRVWPIADTAVTEPSTPKPAGRNRFGATGATGSSEASPAGLPVSRSSQDAKAGESSKLVIKPPQKPVAAAGGDHLAEEEFQPPLPQHE